MLLVAVIFQELADIIENINGNTGRRAGTVFAKESLPGKQEAEKGVAAMVADDQAKQQYQDP
jgi:hypothetical protein